MSAFIFRMAEPMNRAPIDYRLPPGSKEKLTRLRAIERDFHERAFGEELAHVNFDLSIEERHKYLEEMRQLARQHRVPPGHDPFRCGES